MLGHVNHGKTTLLDQLSHQRVAQGEYGGITQHIRAFFHRQHRCTFVDTPGHEAFANLRGRGAHLTDLVCLVVAVDDGPLPTTVEAVRLVRTLRLPCVVVLNKIDRLPDNAREQRVGDILLQIADLSEGYLVAEPLGGDTQIARTSALTGAGIGELVTAITLEADLNCNLSYDPGLAFEGTVLEVPSSITGLGHVAWIIGRQGILRPGSLLVSEDGASAKVRVILEEGRDRAAETAPSMPYVISGWRAGKYPRSGSIVQVVGDEKEAASLISSLKDERREWEQKQVAVGRRLAEEQKIRQRHHLDVKLGIARPRNTYDYEFLKQAPVAVLLKCDTLGSYEAVNDIIQRAGVAVVPAIESPLEPLHLIEDNLVRESPNIRVFYFNFAHGNKERAHDGRRSQNEFYFKSVYEVQRALEELKREPSVARIEVLKIFHEHQGRGVLVGGRVIEGSLKSSAPLDKGMRILSLKRGKQQVDAVGTNEQFGVLLDANIKKLLFKEGDVLEQR